VTPRYALDAWAVLALLQGEEPAAQRVNHLIHAASSGDADLYMSVINLGEVSYRVGRVRGEEEAQAIVDVIRGLAVTIVTSDEDAVFAAARFKMHHAISYADALAAATAEALDAVLLTGDPELIALEGRIHIERLRRGDA